MSDTRYRPFHRDDFTFAKKDTAVSSEDAQSGWKPCSAPTTHILFITTCCCCHDTRNFDLETKNHK